MRTTRLVWIVLISGTGAGCAATAGHAADGLRADAALVHTTSEERRQLRDSALAQSVADEVGPRVTVTADFDYAAGSRRVDARFIPADGASLVRIAHGGSVHATIDPAATSGDSGASTAQSSATNTGDTGAASSTAISDPSAVSGDSGPRLRRRVRVAPLQLRLSDSQRRQSP